MKKIGYLFFALVFLGSCEEIPPEIPKPPTGGDRVVLIEEFSGGSCVPCADAAIILEEQQATFGKKLVVVTMHTLSLGQTTPSFGATYDFRTDQGQQTIENLGLPQGIPSAVINRTQFDGENTLQLRREKWAGKIASELSRDPGVNLNVEMNFDQDRMLNFDVTIVPIRDLVGDVRLTSLITESHIIDQQDTSNGTVDDWEHNHILRAFITGVTGESLGSNLKAGVPIIRSFSFEVPEEDGLWVADHLELVVHVTEETADSREVIQVVAKKFME